MSQAPVSDDRDVTFEAFTSEINWGEEFGLTIEERGMLANDLWRFLATVGRIIGQQEYWKKLEPAMLLNIVPTIEMASSLWKRIAAWTSGQRCVLPWGYVEQIGDSLYVHSHAMKPVIAPVSGWR